MTYRFKGLSSVYVMRSWSKFKYECFLHRVSVSARSGAGDEGDQGEENDSDTEEDEAASVICKDEPGNKLGKNDMVPTAW